MATPEPPVISAWRSAASPIASRCASLTASTIAKRLPCSFSAVIAWRIAIAPCSTVAYGTKPTVPSVCRDSTRTRLASVIGVSGWFSIPLSFSSVPPTNR